MNRTTNTTPQTVAGRPFRLGLTGSIGMGKSTTADLFRAEGCPVWDADAAVHRLYAPGGGLVGPVSALFPSALKEGGIDRPALKAALAGDAGRLRALEAVVHPAAAEDRAAFYRQAAQDGAEIVVFDIPLLFEGSGDAGMDGVAVVSVDAETQARRVLARPGMTVEMLDFIRARQMPDADKRARARWVIPTDTPESARAAVTAICAEIRESRDA